MADTPPPYYLTSGEPPLYCYTCGRLVGSRKIKSGNRSAPSSATSTTSKDGLSGTTTSSSAAKFCSDKCKHNKPSKKPGTLDRTIEDILFLLLQPPDNLEWKRYDFGMMMQACEKSRRLLRQHHSDLLCPSDIVKLDALPFPLSAPSFLEDIKLGASEDTGYRSLKSLENNDYHKYDLNVPNDTRRKSTKKGDHRLTIPCSLVESIVFNRMADVNRRQGRTRAKRLDKMLDLRRLDLKPPTNASSKIWNLYKEAEEQYLESQKREEKEGQVERESRRDHDAEANGGNSADDTGTEESSDDEDQEGETAVSTITGNTPAEGVNDNTVEAAKGQQEEDTRKEGQIRALQREMVRNACRRAVIFGLLPPCVVEKVPTTQNDRNGGTTDDGTMEDSEPDERRKGKSRRKKTNKKDSRHDGGAGDGSNFVGKRRLCEAVMKEEAVEPSFAKGDWGVRWREG